MTTELSYFKVVEKAIMALLFDDIIYIDFHLRDICSGCNFIIYISLHKFSAVPPFLRLKNYAAMSPSQNTHVILAQSVL